MSNTFAGFVLIVIGVMVIIFRKPLADQAVGFQVQVFRLHFGKETLDISYGMAAVTGVLVIVIGILTAFGVIK